MTKHKIALGLTLGLVLPQADAAIGQGTMQVPTYQVDPFWPKPLPKNWILGAVVGVAVTASHRRDHPAAALRSE